MITDYQVNTFLFGFKSIYKNKEKLFVKNTKLDYRNLNQFLIFKKLKF
jgi:hypothetical protein